MNNIEILKNQISAYLDNELSEEESKVMEAAIANSEELKEELAAMKVMRKRMDLFAVPDFDETNVKANFYAMLGKEITKAKTPSILERIKEKLLSVMQVKFGVQLAYALTLLVLGVGIGYFFSPSKSYDKQMSQLSSEMQDMKEMVMLTLLAQKSPTERLKAVSLTSELEDVNDKVINALLQALENDENINVRLAAVEALYNFRENPKAREGLIKSVGKQESPLLQLALVEVIIALQDKRNLPVLQELIKKQDLNEAIKAKAESAIQTLQL